MPGKNKTPLLGWHPRSAETAARLRIVAEQRGVPLARILDEAAEAYLALLPPWWWHDKQAQDGSGLGLSDQER